MRQSDTFWASRARDINHIISCIITNGWDLRCRSTRAGIRTKNCGAKPISYPELQDRKLTGSATSTDLAKRNVNTCLQIPNFTCAAALTCMPSAGLRKLRKEAWHMALAARMPRCDFEGAHALWRQFEGFGVCLRTRRTLQGAGDQARYIYLRSSIYHIVLSVHLLIMKLSGSAVFEKVFAGITDGDVDSPIQSASKTTAWQTYGSGLWRWLSSTSLSRIPPTLVKIGE